jgi:cell division protein FtsA
MKNSKLNLFLEINTFNYIFFVGKSDENNDLEIIFKLELPLIGIENNKISDSEKILNLIKENLFLIEQKFNHTFKEIIIILENLNPTFVNLSGFKKLNGSQILRENITYILSTLKSRIEEIESNKKILHIFNSKFSLDNNNIENLPIGLFGDFYSHELSFSLINKNDYKNLKNILNKCNLKIERILIKSFVQGVNICERKDKDTFFSVEINEKKSKILLFEKSSFKSEQYFDFGTDIILKDISKITSLKIETVKSILKDIDLKKAISEDELVASRLFEKDNYRKIKKKLIYDIAFARIKEICEIIIFQNINFKYSNKIPINIYLNKTNTLKNLKCLEEIFDLVLSTNDTHNVISLDQIPSEKVLISAYKLAHFGWKKEAIPFSKTKKSIIARFFDMIFG